MADGRRGSSIVLKHLSGITAIEYPPLATSCKQQPSTGDYHSNTTNGAQCSASSSSSARPAATAATNAWGQVEVMAGTTFYDLHRALDERGLGLAWLSGGIQGLTVRRHCRQVSQFNHIARPAYDSSLTRHF